MEEIYSIYGNRSSAECIGQRIRSRRKERGFKSCTELAKKLWGTSVVDDSDSLRKKMESIERGRSTISIDDLLKLSKILECDPDYLLCLPSCTQPTREATDIVAATGLSAKAVERLKLNYNFVEKHRGSMSSRVSPLAIISMLLQDSEFWRAVNNASALTDDTFSIMNQYLSGEKDVDYSDQNTELLMLDDGEPHLMSLSIANHITNAVMRTVKKEIEKEVPPNGE